MKIIGIGGGSGSGKSTVSYALQDAHPDKIEVINLDDYQKLNTGPNLPMIDGMINWDHPDIISWAKLIADIETLKSGRTITIMTWAHRSNSDYTSSGHRIPRTIKSKPIVLIEGYLALYHPKLNKLYDKSYYFDLNEKIRHMRRNKDVVIGEEDYVEKVLEPMHRQFVEPTKKFADEVINISDKSVEEIRDILLSEMFL